MPDELQTIPDGRPGLDAKVAKVRELVEQAKRSSRFRARAVQLVRHLPERDTDAEVAAVFDFVRDNIRFTRDPWAPGGLELFTAPAAMLEQIDAGMAAGDCDDHVILASALLETLGHRTRYRIGGLPPDHFRHIWLEVQTKRGWLPLELVNKREPMGWDPSDRFPLTLTLDGTMTHNAGLGALVPLARRRVGPSLRTGGFDPGSPAYYRRQVAAKGKLPERLGFRYRARDVNRAGKLVRTTLGDYEVPPSWENTPQEARWYGVTPSDVWRNDELAGDELEGFGRSLRKLRKKVTGKLKKAAKTVKAAPKKIAKQAKRNVANVKQFRSGLAAAVKGGVGRLFSGMAQQQADYTPDPGAAMMPITDPSSTGLYPPPLFSEDYGGGGGIGPEFQEPMPEPDPWGAWDAQTETEEVDSLYTPATAAEMGPDAELPGAGEGSFVPTPAWPETVDPYTEPAYGNQGMDYDAMDVSDPVALYGENESDLGDWMEELAKNVIAPIAQTTLAYQQAKLQAKAAQRGYPALQFGATVPAVPQTPVPSVPAQSPAPTMPPIIVQAPEPTPVPAAAGLGRYGPWIMLGGGALVLFALMSSTRRRR